MKLMLYANDEIWFDGGNDIGLACVRFEDGLSIVGNDVT